jgi:sortase A
MTPDAAHRQTARLLTGFERIFFSIGFALLTIWGAKRLESIVFSRAAFAEFQANQTTKASGTGAAPHRVPPISAMNFVSWPSLSGKVDAPLAVLRIPRIHLVVPVFNGTDGATLNRGVGRIIGTARLGERGNLAIAGHRDGFFRGLKDVAQGDVIELVRPGKSDLYVIDRIQIVSPKDVSVLNSTATPSLTLVTCFPFYFVGGAPQRYVVTASLRGSNNPDAASPIHGHTKPTTQPGE